MIKDGRGKTIACAVEPLLTIDVIEAAHTAYSAWWDMAHALFLKVRHKLQAFEVTRFDAPRAPWARGVMPRPRDLPLNFQSNPS